MQVLSFRGDVCLLLTISHPPRLTKLNNLKIQEVVRKKKLELQRKEERERELKDQAKLRRKNWAEEQKR